jgi:hypothetical protein
MSPIADAVWVANGYLAELDDIACLQIKVLAQQDTIVAWYYVSLLLSFSSFV